MATNPTATPEVTTWEIDPAHSSAQFKVRHMMISNVKGEFTKISGYIKLNHKDISRSSAETSIDAASISTRDEQRDGHLKSADFLDVAKFPTMTFRTAKISRGAKGDVEAAGDLTIHGVTRPVVFEVEGPTPETKDPWGNARIGLSATTHINRKDFGLTWNTSLETGGLLVGEEVAITLDVELLKKAEA